MAIDLDKRHYNKYGEKIVSKAEPQPLKEEEIIPEIYPQNEKYPGREVYPQREQYPKMKVYPEQNNYPQPKINPQTAPAVPAKKTAPVILRVLAGIAWAFIIWFVFFFIIGIVSGAKDESFDEHEPDIDNSNYNSYSVDNYRTYSFAAADIEKITADIPYTYFYVYSDEENYSDDINVSINCEENLNLRVTNENGELKIISDEPNGDFSFTYDRYIDICLPADCSADISLNSYMGMITCQDLKGGTFTLGSSESDISLSGCNFESAEISASGAENHLNIDNFTGKTITLDTDNAGTTNNAGTYISFLAAHELSIDTEGYLSISSAYVDGASEIHSDSGNVYNSAFSGNTKIICESDIGLTNSRFSGNTETESMLGEIFLSSCSTENLRLKAKSYLSAELSESKENYTVIKNGVRERTGEYTINAESEENDINIDFDCNEPHITEVLRFAEKSDFLS